MHRRRRRHLSIEILTNLNFAEVWEFRVGDESFGFSADINDDEIFADFHDFSFDDPVGLERAETGFSEQFFHDTHIIYFLLCVPVVARTGPGFGWVNISFWRVS